MSIGLLSSSLQARRRWLSQVSIGCFVVLAPLAAQAEAEHPRLFIDRQRIQQIQVAVQVPQSHHQQAFEALKARVDQQDWRLYDDNPNDGNWNYARSYLAREAAFLYLITNNRKYAQVAHSAITAIYNAPDPDNRLPEQGYGLSRATVGSNIAIAYDWAYQGLTAQQRTDIQGKINAALDAWTSYQHVNLSNPAMASNWVAVCRGGELVMMLAVYEEENRDRRYTQLKEWLKTHLANAYGELGLSQEGIAYTGYAGIFLVPAVYALRSVGDTALEEDFRSRRFWKLMMYVGAFAMDRDGERTFLPSGVSATGIIDEGWASLLLGSVPPRQQPFYRYFYDYHMGVKAPGTPAEKFDERRGATAWSLIYYPESAPSLDPTGIYANAIADEKRGAYFFRNRWQDENDLLVAIAADIEQHGNAWNKAEAFQLGLLAYDTRFIIGPAKDDRPDRFSTLLVDGEAQVNSSTTGAREFFQASSDGGYVIVDGGSKYASLGLDSAKRHLLVEFDRRANQALLVTLDRLRDRETHSYTWQLNFGEKIDGAIQATTSQEYGLPVFLLRGNNGSYLKGWVLHPGEVRVRAEETLQVSVFGSDVDIWVVMIVGQGDPPIAKVMGEGMRTQLQLENVVVNYDPQSERVVVESESGFRETRKR